MVLGDFHRQAMLLPVAGQHRLQFEAFGDVASAQRVCGKARDCGCVAMPNVGIVDFLQLGRRKYRKAREGLFIWDKVFGHLESSFPGAETISTQRRILLFCGERRAFALIWSEYIQVILPLYI
ncbi:hypothetical protein CWR43_21265 [Rhizobium sullae]|uniref:Uncharacterized protein n=1 Tax=Rhizobium sullae TaxID=50338 RepID=A0A2N0D6Y4_RHISU|nr:hypothetical protein CWR43_21265 [Rhizobium sullae]